MTLGCLTGGGGFWRGYFELALLLLKLQSVQYLLQSETTTYIPKASRGRNYTVTLKKTADVTAF